MLQGVEGCGCRGEGGFCGVEFVDEVDVFAADFVGPEEGCWGWGLIWVGHFGGLGD